MPQKISAQVYSYLREYGSSEGFAYQQWRERSFIFLEPVLKCWADEKGSHLESVQDKQDFSEVFAAFESLQAKLRQGTGSIPCAAGYFAYELSRTIEEVKTAVDSSNFPLYVFYLYRKVIEISPLGKTCRQFEWKELTPFWYSAEPKHVSTEKAAGAPPTVEEVERELAPFSNFTRPEYIDSVAQIQRLIEQGEVYQVNLTQQFSLPAREEKDFCERFIEAGDAAYAGFLRSSVEGEGFSIVSSSPERFLECDGETLITSPIKGTKFSHEADEAAFQTDEKVLSELSMIVDIERNDFSKVAAASTVKVAEHARLERLPFIDHLISDVTCRLREGCGVNEVIRAAFPSGSISGAPKIAAMNIIAELERRPRGVYTGSLGFLAPAGTFGFNVAIRTALIRGGTIHYSAGGGIVLDSNPQEEYIESLAKTLAFYQAYRDSAPLTNE